MSQQKKFLFKNYTSQNKMIPDTPKLQKPTPK